MAASKAAEFNEAQMEFLTNLAKKQNEEAEGRYAILTTRLEEEVRVRKALKKQLDDVKAPQTSVGRSSPHQDGERQAEAGGTDSMPSRPRSLRSSRRCCKTSPPGSNRSTSRTRSINHAVGIAYHDAEVTLCPERKSPHLRKYQTSNIAHTHTAPLQSMQIRI